VAGLAGATALGYWIGTSQITWAYWSVLVAVAAIVIAGLRQHAWILIYLGWALTAQTGFLPYRLSLRDVCVVLAVIAYLAYSAVDKRRLRLRWMALDWVLVANLAWLAIVYLRHPIGTQIFRSEMIGGRAYVNIALATACYWVTTRLPDSTKLVARVPLMMLASVTVGTVLYLMAVVLPGVAGKLQILYAAFSIDAYVAGIAFEYRGVARLGTGDFGLLLTSVLCAYYSPRTLFHPLRWRSWVFGLGLLGIFLSGFRNALLQAFANLSLSSWLRHGWRELALVAGLGTLLFGGLIIGHGRFYTLPLGVQRSLAWLPGQWNPDVVSDVTGSNTRWEWWRRIIRDRHITDWWLGQGFGASFSDVAALYWTGTDDFQQGMELWGGYHNGPLSTIRVTGVVGLILYYTLLVVTAFYAVRTVRLCQGTPLYPLAMFVALGAVWSPIHFTFIFGSYGGDLARSILMIGLLRLLLRMSAATSPAASATPANQVDGHLPSRPPATV
jgi:hypothetical protein